MARQRRIIQVCFSEGVHALVAEFAKRGGLSLSASVRLLVERALEPGVRRPVRDQDAALASRLKTLGASALATLIATEQNQKLLISILPEGSERAEQLWEAAATSARNRLIRIDQALAEEML
jgi:hypothetical protein